MDLQPHSEAESALVSTTNTTGSDARYAGAFFPWASAFSIRGGAFTSNVTNNVYSLRPEQPSEFQTIRVGDMKLVNEVSFGPQFGVVGCQTRRVGVRRIYHAEIRRDPGTVTVAIYQGDGAEEEWRQHMAKYESIRHPHIMQLYGLVSAKGLYAMVFHDELIPYAQFLRRFQHSHILSTYIRAYCSTEFQEATNYMYDLFRKPSIDYNTPAWIRSATGALCLDLAQGGPETGFDLPWRGLGNLHVLRVKNVSLNAPNFEDILTSSLSEDQYHELCSERPIARFQWFQVSTQHPVGPGIFQLDSQHGTCLGITEPLILPEAETDQNWDQSNVGKRLPNSWIRFDSRRTPGLRRKLWTKTYELQKAWLAQANRIFAELEDKRRVENYVCVDYVHFSLRIADMGCIPEGYLFVCPAQHFRASIAPHAHLYQWPACPAYWSLDPSGAARLSTEDAGILGFPAIHTETVIGGDSWDGSVYQGLLRFHESKGFDPNSWEVAQQFGHPLFEVLSDLGSKVPFPARCVEKWRCEEEEDPALCRELGHYL
ncbi:hypothetical protein MSAN_01515500 [Mycena sanguinolenta]|uniref:Protein kinase domain-containing protein n=1 Tax=Mycena sanguinolenta TaxID=230812 RepID=A0A8H7CZ51_9AGAR|nr:hypothetical protein MSAN_01515500 [Mycena sanguinolenta]